MSDFVVDTPIALIIYKRPDTTRQVLDALAQVRPARLFVIGDGPRANHPDEAEQVEAARALIEKIDWGCEVITNYADANLGLRQRVVSGLDWVFKQVDRAIILEDDCVPEVSFFPFCEELLDRYQDDERVMTVSGNNFQRGRRRTQYSYYFSRYNHSTGWATWRRAWLHYDDEMSLWPEIREGNWLVGILGYDKHALKFWTRVFDKVYARQIDSWSYCWKYSCWLQGALTILPNVNLVSHIGYGRDATHTIFRSRSGWPPVESLDFPLKHPPFCIRDALSDQFTQNNVYGTSLEKRVKRRVMQVLRALGWRH